MTNEQLQLILNEVAPSTWETYLRKLTFYAQKEISQHYWRGNYDGTVPGGLEATDIALEAIEDTWSGERTWNPDEQPDLLKFLYGVVKSKVSKYSTREENKSEIRLEEEHQDVVVPTLPEYVRHLPLHEEVEYADLVVGFIVFNEDDKDIQKLIYCIEECVKEGKAKRQDIAEKLGVSVIEVTNRQKRMKRKADAFFAQRNTEDGVNKDES